MFYPACPAPGGSIGDQLDPTRRRGENREGTHMDLRERCKRRLSRAEEAALYGDLLAERDLDLLKAIVKDADCESDYRAAALENLISRKPAVEAQFVESQVSSDSDEVRRAALLWQAARTLARTRTAVKTRGAAAEPAADWYEKAAGDPSPRVNWLAKLGD
jgi:hypothetical protein